MGKIVRMDPNPTLKVGMCPGLSLQLKIKVSKIIGLNPLPLKTIISNYNTDFKRIFPININRWLH